MEGCRSIFWMQGSGAAATVGSPVGKISAALWSGVEPAITINERKRPVRAHKGKKRYNPRQRITGGMEGRREGERETTRGNERRTKRVIKKKRSN